MGNTKSKEGVGWRGGSDLFGSLDYGGLVFKETRFETAVIQDLLKDLKDKQYSVEVAVNGGY